MNLAEKKKLRSQLSEFHGDLEALLVKWFYPSARKIRTTLDEKFTELFEELKV